MSDNEEKKETAPVVEEEQKEDPQERQKKVVAAIQGLIRAANLAQSKGAFTFDESAEVHKHIKVITNKE